MTKLTAAFVRTVKRPGVYCDLHGLKLRVNAGGTKYWLWQGTVKGRGRVDRGIGTYPYVTLAEARDTAFDFRRMAKRGVDPRELQRQKNVPTFKQAAERVIALNRPIWKAGASTERVWRGSLRDHVFPKLGDRRVDNVTTADIQAVLFPIWTTKAVTAKAVLQRIGAVMKWAIAEAYRNDDPCAAVMGNLPKNGGTHKHQRALPHGQVAGALAKVRECEAWKGARLALEFLVLTAVRSSEVCGATWDEVDMEARTWAIPAARMKGKREHRVPLSDQAVAVLTKARELSGGTGLIFPSAQHGKALADGTLARLLRRLALAAVPHGFRSSFRDWCADTGVDRQVAEACLAHVVGGVEGAYLRSDLLERRRKVMAAWGSYLLLS